MSLRKTAFVASFLVSICVTGPLSAQEKCWLYPNLKFGSCSSLIRLDSLHGSDKQTYTYPAPTGPIYAKPTRLIDLNGIPGASLLTKDFRFSEFLSPEKGRYGYVAEYALLFIQKLRDSIGKPLRITSGYRSPAYNNNVGGVPYSRHSYGDGFDIAAANIGMSTLKKQCLNLNASFIQLYTDGHVHCDWRNHKPDPTFIDTSSNKSIWPETLSTEDFMSFQYALSGAPQIHLQEQKSARRDGVREVNLTATLPYQEDPGDLFTEWIIYLPNGHKQIFNGKSISLRVDQRGKYTIRSRVGGFVESAMEFSN